MTSTSSTGLDGPDTDQRPAAVAELRTTAAIRARAGQLLDRARNGQSSWFEVDDAALADCAALVADVTRSRYPDLDVPFHSRWRHFEAGDVVRAAALNEQLANDDMAARARTWIDVTVVSVLLDAGAGADWSYHEVASGQRFSRSEGLGVASWNAFCSGLFSGDPAQPYRVDAAGLRAITTEDLAAAFQVSSANPLVGLDGRVLLLHRLADALGDQPEAFGAAGRPGGLFDRLTSAVGDAPLQAHDILAAILQYLSRIWPSENNIDGIAVGDCWYHGAVDGTGLTRGWMPFHKLSQWLTYSLLEPFVWAGVHVDGLDALTGLPEYRNGGLLLDTNVLRLLDPAVAQGFFSPQDELVVEWRALTVALIDELAPLVRAQLGVTADDFPLARVLEGGTWAAGRALAQTRRDGLPPLNINSDGTVF